MRLQKSLLTTCLKLSASRNLFRFLWNRVRQGRPLIRFTGSYQTYSQALSRCSGYDSKLILDKVLASTLLVLSGHAIAERDGVTLSTPYYSSSILSGLLIANSRISGPLCVLDFGGSLGSSFLQCRQVLKYLPPVDWNIVEQSHFVSAGRSMIKVTNLSFFESIDECASLKPISVCLLSGVLQCIPNPFEILEKMISLAPEVLILDRTPYLTSGAAGYYAVQHVPRSIYSATYPSRFFLKSELLEPISAAGYDLVGEFPCVDDLVPYAQWLGHVFVRNLGSSFPNSGL